LGGPRQDQKAQAARKLCRDRDPTRSGGEWVKRLWSPEWRDIEIQKIGGGVTLEQETWTGTLGGGGGGGGGGVGRGGGGGGEGGEGRGGGGREISQKTASEFSKALDRLVPPPEKKDHRTSCPLGKNARIIFWYGRVRKRRAKG